MKHQQVEQWESNLNELLKRVDQALEERFGNIAKSHPARPEHGTTANPQQDGLFRVTASFTAGFGSELGRGYVLQFDMVTLHDLPQTKKEEIETFAVSMIKEGLEQVLPGRGLQVKKDGKLWKIVGDLSLGERESNTSPPTQE